MAAGGAGEAAATFDPIELVDALRRHVQEARGMPMSASCVVNRDEVLELLDMLREALPHDIGRARAVLAERAAVLEAAQAEADRVVAEAQAVQEELVSEHHVTRRAEAEAARILGEARQQVAALRQEVDDYVDGRLANFEVVLARISDAVRSGRAAMRGSPGSERRR